MKTTQRIASIEFLACIAMIFAASESFAAITISQNAGFSITFDGNDGRFAGTVVPTNLADAAGTSSFGSSNHPAPAHTIPHINDALYGNDNSWLADPGDGDPRIGVGLGGLKQITSFAFGRANNTSHVDRTDGIYALQFTTDAVPGLGSTWTSIGTLTYTDEGDIDDGPGGIVDEYLRHEFAVRQNGNPISATGFRFQNNNNAIAIDELEIYSDNQSIAAIGPRAWLKSDQGVVASGGSVTRWGDRTSNAHDAVPGGGATLASTQINGLPGVVFNGASHHLDIPTTASMGLTNADYEMFVVAKSASSAIQFLTAAGTGAGIENFELHLNGSSGARFIPRNGGIADIGAIGGFTDGLPHLFNVRVSGNMGFIAVDGAPSPQTVAAAQSANNQVLTLGVRGDATFRFDGAMGEVLIFNGGLSATQRSNVETALQDKWQFVYRQETGGTMNAAANFALAANGGVAFAKDLIGNGAFAPTHTIDNLNDGFYGNGDSWIGETDPTFAGVAMASGHLIDRIAFGRDNTGAFGDRVEGVYTLQYTTVGSPNASTPDGDWTTIAALSYAATFPDTPSLRHVWEIPAVFATGVRILVNQGGLDGGLAIDEIEIYTVPEPASVGLMILGGLLLARSRRSRRMIF